MSAWPEAVWVYKKLQNNFNFTQQVKNYTDAMEEALIAIEKDSQQLSEYNDDVRKLFFNVVKEENWNQQTIDPNEGYYYLIVDELVEE